MSRPTPRKSSLAGTSPADPVAPATPATAHPAPLTPTREVSPRAAAEPPAAAHQRKPKRVKAGYYTDADLDGRLRAGFFAARNDYGWRNTTDMHVDGMTRLLTELEARYNGGKPFEGMPPGTGPVGKPVGE